MSKSLHNTPDFETVMRENGPRIYSLAVRLTGNLPDGQDLAQETFLKAYRSWRHFRGDADLSTWLYRICVNAWKNRVRYEKRRSFWQHFSLDSKSEDENSPYEIAASEASPDQPLEFADRVEQLHAALARLEPDERAIVVLRDMEDKPYEEVARELGIPMGTVKSRLARSRERLRIILQAASKNP